METTTLFLPDYQPSDDLEVDNDSVYAPRSSSITNKYMVYKQMGGSSTIIIKVYSRYGGSPKLKRNTRLMAENVLTRLLL